MKTENREEIIEIFVRHGYNRKAVEEYTNRTAVYLDVVEALEHVLDIIAKDYDVSDEEDASWALVDFDMISG